MKYLIVKTSALGDVLQTLPALDYLRSKAPFAQIDWVAEKEICSLLQRHPSIDRFIPLETKKWKKGGFRGIRQAIAQLRQTHYDAIFDFQGNFKSWCVRLFARSHVSIGWDWNSVAEKWGRLGLDVVFPCNTGENIRLQYLHLVSQFFWEPRATLSNPTPLNISVTPKKKKPTVLVCMGSRWPSKQIPSECWIEALKGVEGTLVFVAATLHEEVLAKRVISELGKGELLPKGSLEELYAHMKASDLVCGVDSMPLHLAAYADVPTVSIFGPSRKEVYQPLGEKHQAVESPCSFLGSASKRCRQLRSCSMGTCWSLSSSELGKAIKERLEKSVLK